MDLHFGVFIPQGWKMELASIDDPVDKWAKAVEISVLAEELGYCVDVTWSSPPEEDGDVDVVLSRPELKAYVEQLKECVQSLRDAASKADFEELRSVFDLPQDPSSRCGRLIERESASAHHRIETPHHR